MNEPRVRVVVHPDLLSRREHFAMAALQGLLSATPPYGNYSIFAESAVELADALIAKLDKVAA